MKEIRMQDLDDSVSIITSICDDCKDSEEFYNIEPCNSCVIKITKPSNFR